jgi:hypothetical protein
MRVRKPLTVLSAALSFATLPSCLPRSRPSPGRANQLRAGDLLLCEVPARTVACPVPAIFERASQYRGTCATKFLCHFAEILGKQRCNAKALAVLDDAFRLAAERGERYYLSELERVSGEI